MDTAGIRRALAHAIRKDVWFSDTWHFPGMARAAEIVEKGDVVISPQEAGSVTTTEPAHPYEYWNKRIREEVVEQLLTAVKESTHTTDSSFRLGLEHAAEIVGGA